MKKKAFDCVQMKHEIQQQVMKEIAGLSCEERRQRLEDAIRSDPILGRIWQRARRIDTGGKPARDA